MKKIICVLFVATLFVSGCGTDDDDDSVQSLTLTGASGNQVALDGQWSAGCKADIGDVESERGVVTFSGSSLTVIDNVWENTIDCSGESDWTMSKSGSLTLGEEVTALLNSSPVTATKIDIVVSSALMTPNNSTTANYMNTESMCGFTDWVAGTAKDVLDTDCQDTSSSHKDILYVDDTVNPNRWYDGLPDDEGGNPDANGYPTVLDPSHVNMR